MKGETLKNNFLLEQNATTDESVNSIFLSSTASFLRKEVRVYFR